MKAFGLIPGSTGSGLQLCHGHSKDHRPDLRQSVFQLSISHDGAVPVYHHVYPGNRNDDTTHRETWDRLCEIHGSVDFLYVADCKLCTKKQLEHIVSHGGGTITILPQNRMEVRASKQRLREGPIDKRIIWRRPKPSDESQTRTWAISIEGEVKESLKFDIDEVINMFPLEERVYHWRCVEAWGMIIPWVGCPLARVHQEMPAQLQSRIHRGYNCFG